jgi:hypothetical protein
LLGPAREVFCKHLGEQSRLALGIIRNGQALEETLADIREHGVGGSNQPAGNDSDVRS